MSFVASSLHVEMEIDTEVLTPGSKGQVTMTITNEGNQKIKHIDATLVTPESWGRDKTQKSETFKTE